MSLNFAIVWAFPIMGMGLLWKHAFKSFLMPLYDIIDKNTMLRGFAKEYIYTKPEHSDFFAITILLLMNSTVSLGFVFYWQLRYGYLPWWLVLFYNCSWVGIGGRVMGGAYTLAHKEVSYSDRS